MRVLMVQSDPQTASTLARLFEARKDKVWDAEKLDEASALIDLVRPELLVFDLHFPDEGWLDFLRQLRQNYPQLKILFTNKHPDVQRELLAQQYGVYVFLRQPFTERWLERALQRLESKAGNEGATPQSNTAPIPRIRVSVRAKILLSYLALMVIIILSGILISRQLNDETNQVRLDEQLQDASARFSHYLKEEEHSLVATLRLLTNRPSVQEAFQSGDVDLMLSEISTVFDITGDETVAVLDASGTSLFVLTRRQSGDSGYDMYGQENSFREMDFVQNTLIGLSDPGGAAASGIGKTEAGTLFFVCLPIFDADHNVLGVILVGKTLPTLLREAKAAERIESSLFSPAGEILASSLALDSQKSSIPINLYKDLISHPSKNYQRIISAAGSSYIESLLPWRTQAGRNIGLIGVSVPYSDRWIVSPDLVTRIAIQVAAICLLVIFTGLVLSDRISTPLKRLSEAASEVARGNLVVKVQSQGNDEVAILGHTFNYMVAGLQQEQVYRNLFGNEATPEVYRQLHRTFTSGALRLEGQEIVATIISISFHNFTDLTSGEPRIIFESLNEYYDAIMPHITSRGGMIARSDNNETLIFFGILPRILVVTESSFSACQAALDMLQVIQELNNRRREHGAITLNVGMGVHTGLVKAGGLRLKNALHYAAVGQALRIAQEVAIISKDYFEESGILITQDTWLALAENRKYFLLADSGPRILYIDTPQETNLYNILPPTTP